MIRISDISLPLDHDDDALRNAVAKTLEISPAAITQQTIVRRSIDARKRNHPAFTYTVDVALAKNAPLSPQITAQRNVIDAPDTTYQFNIHTPAAQQTSPVVVGMGPCGLFGALLLARLGLRPIVLERGKPVRERMRHVRAFWRDGVLNPASNALFGEGGAGAFSDGKLSSQSKDRENRRSWILNELVCAGAPEEILFSSKPHIGTNKLITVVEKIRAAIIAAGGTIRFDSCVTNLIVEKGRLRSLEVNGNEELHCEQLLLAIGHSARDTYTMLNAKEVRLSQKAFSIGARIEHPQTLIDKAQYGSEAGHPRLGAADYKAAWHCKNGRSVYTFCVCPGGHVIAACHEPETIATNGMSHYARKGKNANGGLLVGVGPTDYDDAHPLAGIAFQQRWERAAYLLGGGGYNAPVQLVGDLLAGRASTRLGDVPPSYGPGVTPADLRECLPDYVIQAWREGIPAIARKIRGFDMPDAVLTGVETRSSSPVRIDRDDTCQSVSVQGLFPAGEGAGYAGGIMSAAMDGMRAAEQIALAANYS